jgi:outer membrane protein
MFIAWNQFNAPKLAYVDIKTVYDEFELKKELEKNYTQTIGARQKNLDSIALQIKIYERRAQGKAINDEIYKTMIAEFYEKKKIYTEDNEALAQKIDEQILTQINKLIKDYGDANNYTFIFGANGNGTLMFAKESKNITKPFVEFLNTQYKKEK